MIAQEVGFKNDIMGLVDIVNRMWAMTKDMLRPQKNWKKKKKKDRFVLGALKKYLFQKRKFDQGSPPILWAMTENMLRPQKKFKKKKNRFVLGALKSTFFKKGNLTRERLCLPAGLSKSFGTNSAPFSGVRGSPLLCCPWFRPKARVNGVSNCVFLKVKNNQIDLEKKWIRISPL